MWLYNLHYFDYLNQPSFQEQLGIKLIKDWVAGNPVASSDGWEPYPVSLRIVNWVKFLSRTAIAREDLNCIQESLFIQSRFLFCHLEYHLLGNHLFKNAVALLYAGYYFENDEAEKWAKKALHILNQQLQEQVLLDGGHIERSPMYHVLILEDILDSMNMMLAVHDINEYEVELFKGKAASMLSFLAAILHQDGTLPFFNDCALSIAPDPVGIFVYAASLGLDANFYQSPVYQKSSLVSFIEKPDSGLYIVVNRKSKMIIDAGPIGPDYLPGHAHCDTLSFELSINGQRCIVNSGTYQYAGEHRNGFRATKAHNTVRIDGAEQHEIWSTFRVARRGYPCDVGVTQTDQTVRFSAAHTGYQRLTGNPIHRREVICNETSWQIIDRIEGNGIHLAESFIHLHPNAVIEKFSEKNIGCSTGNVFFTIAADEASFFSLEEGYYSPEFGIKEINKIVVIRKTEGCPISMSYRIEIGD